LKKKKIVLSFEEEGKWEDYFLPEQQKAQEIKAQITKTDKEIDAMVYDLYDLTDEEIAIVENS
jgi:type II restriction/modification system DNA methylase subunit YeeA